MVRLNAIDLFAGAGGLSLGFQQAGFNLLYANEFDPKIAEAYRTNHPGTEVSTSDITSLNLDEEFSRFRGKITVVVGGPPCQGFSQKGSRRSILDERNYLFRHFVQVVKIVKPKYFVMENVPNLLTSEKGAFKHELIRLFEEIGFRTSAEVLNAAAYGVPQNRRRAIIIGKYGNSRVTYPIPSESLVTVWDAISDLSYLRSGEGSQQTDYLKPPETEYQKQLRNSSTQLFNHQATRHTQVALERLALIPENCTQKVLPAEHRTKSIHSGTWTRLDAKGQAPTITTRFDTPSSGQFSHPKLNRAITVREAARLQSFPDAFVFTGPKNSQMRQVGNAVPPLLSRAIAKSLLSNIKGDKQ